MSINILRDILNYLDKESYLHIKSSKEYKTINKQKEEIVQLIIDISKVKIKLGELN